MEQVSEQNNESKKQKTDLLVNKLYEICNFLNKETKYEWDIDYGDIMNTYPNPSSIHDMSDNSKYYNIYVWKDDANKLNDKFMDIQTLLEQKFTEAKFYIEESSRVEGCPCCQFPCYNINIRFNNDNTDEVKVRRKEKSDEYFKNFKENYLKK